jgi:hypothetical protein
MAGRLTVSTLNNDTGVLATQNGMTGIAKAWVNFGYVSSAITVRDSFNVSSVTRTGTGLYNVNLTTAMASTSYAPQVTASRYAASTSYACSGYAKNTSTSQIFVYTGYEDSYSGQIPTDAEFCYVAVLGN